MDFDLSRLGERRFEDLCRALAVHVLGAKLQAFGDGPDGGREATIEGPLAYPTFADPWDDLVVLQAKFRRAKGGPTDLNWLRRILIKELGAWSEPERRRIRDARAPQYLIIATNVRLSSVPGRGGIDAIDGLIGQYAERIGLKGWAVWDGNQIGVYLDSYRGVAARFSELITGGDVLARTMEKLDALDAAGTGSQIRVGQGHAANARPFQLAYDAAGGAGVLGAATSEVYDDGPGWVQHFAGAPGVAPAVISARFEHAAVAVDAEVWDAIANVAAGRDRFDAGGYPVASGGAGVPGSGC